MNTFGRALSAALIVVGAGASALAADHAWNIYANARFGYEICYPADLLVTRFESDNGDGVVLSSKSGAELRVWGGYNVLEEDMDTIIARHASEDAVVSYRRTGKDWAVISGKDKGTVFYVKALLERNPARDIETERAFRLTYPTSEARTYDAVADRLAKCFRPNGRGIDDGLQPLPRNRHDGRTLR
uniref:Uncharacterized protein n=1 Tax=Bosea sp. NBC_00436 TaxID=2969620 RepID=A0A9E7ZRH2_9HYPH